jgi:carotenoid cleavage dioxygenase
MTTQFPITPHYSGFNAPSRLESDLYDLEVEGEIPADLHGTWFRCGPDPQFPPLLGEDIYISGDGMMSMFRFNNGHVDYKSRYVRTERFLAEREARRALFGLYRNRYTDDPSVAALDRGAANTTAWWHAGKLFALKEDSLPYEIDPDTLETKGRWDYNGMLKSQTVTAHPKLDPETGECIFFGYEASGDASTDIAYCVADNTGKLIREDWFKAPYCSMMHDFAVTRDYVIFPIYPATSDLDRLKAGGDHWVWDSSKDTYVGIMRRDGSVNDIRWFRKPPCFAFHVMNAYNEGETVHFDVCISNIPSFPYIDHIDGTQANPEDGIPFLTRWTFDLSNPGESFEERVMSPIPGELPRVDDRDATLKYRAGYYLGIDPSIPLHQAGPSFVGPNLLVRVDMETGELRPFSFGNQATLQEPQFVPSDNGGGYVLVVVDEHDRNESYVAILDAEHPERGTIAKCKLPMRLRTAFHGNWVSADTQQAAVGAAE